MKLLSKEIKSIFMKFYSTIILVGLFLGHSIYNSIYICIIFKIKKQKQINKNLSFHLQNSLQSPGRHHMAVLICPPDMDGSQDPPGLWSIQASTH